MRFLMSLFLSIIIFTGCSYSPKPREIYSINSPLYIKVKKTKTGYSIKSLSDSKGDFILNDMSITSPKVINKFCAKKNDLKCIDGVIDVLIKRYDRAALVDMYARAVMLNKEHLKRLDIIYNSVAPKYKKDKKTIALDYRVNDVSRLYEGEDLGLSDILYVGENDLTYPTAVNHAKRISKVFPSSVKKYKKTIALVSKYIKNKSASEEETYQKTIVNRSSNYPLVRTKNLQSGDYALAIKAPKKVNRGDTTKHRVVIGVVGKNFKNLFPSRFMAKNHDITLEFSTKDMTFINHTKRTIMLESLTFFYNGYKSTVPLGRSFSFSKIPSNQSTTTSSSKFLTKKIQKAAVFKNVTKKNAKEKMVTFTLRLDYRILKRKKIKDNKLLVFSHTEKHRLWDFIH